MLDDYFSENFGGNTVKVDQTLQATFELNSLSDTKGLATISKSDSIKIDEVVTTNASSTEHAAFSLSDLANQYLSGSNSASSFMPMPMPTPATNMGSTDKLSNTGFAPQSYGDKPISTSVKTNGESLFQLSLENLLNKNQSRPRTIFSRSSHNSESGLGEDVRSSREAMTPTSFKMPNFNELKLIPPNYLAKLNDDKRLELLKHLFIITDKSTFGDILSLNGGGRLSDSLSTFKLVENATNEHIEDEFNYSTQKSRFKRKLRRAAKTTSTDSEIENDKPTKKAKASDKLVVAGSRTKSSKKRMEALKAFDFSVPSPDDVVFAKQKLAFKRFK